MEKSTSCGVLVLDATGQLLLCHASDSRYWDIPKGGRDAREQGAQTAVREAFEECGLRLSPAQLREIGLFRYRKEKDLWLFAVLVRHFEANPACVQASTRIATEDSAPRWKGSAGLHSSSCPGSAPQVLSPC